jgi:Lrp/AsnC family leucine-responsive transcriptional regulator
MKLQLDVFDVKILDIIQRNNRLATEQIAEEVGLSPSAVQRRLRRLRKGGVIVADVAILSPEAVGRGVTAIVEVTLEHEHPHILDDFKKSMIATPEVMQCYYVTGNADFVLIITAKDIKDYEAFSYRTFSSNPLVRRFNTSIVMNTVKSGSVVPLELEHL